MSALRKRWKVATLAVAIVALAATAAASVATARNDAKTPIKIGVLSDCQGDFGSFDNQDLAGVDAAMVQFAGGKIKNPNKPRDGWTGASVNGHPLELVGVGCSDDRADTAIKETKRLMEQLGADVMIGPLSGDESIAVANYAKQHPKKTFVDGAAGAQDTTLKVRAKNFFRFNGDGAQWNAGLGDLAYNKLHWRKVAIVADDYSFAWTSAAGFISEFCAVGGQITKRVFPPLNTTDYSSYAQQMPTNVDGTFVAVGGAGLIPFLKAYESAHGPINGSKFIGNLFWGTPGQYQQLGTRVAGAYFGGAGTAGDLATPAAEAFSARIAKDFKTIPPFGAAKGQESSVFLFSYYANTWGLLKGLKAVGGNIASGQGALQAALGKVQLNGPYGPIKLDKNRQAILNAFYGKLLVKNGKLVTKTVGEVPGINQTFGGTFSSKTPPPGRNFPTCTKRKLPWIGKTIHPKVTG